MRSPRTSSRRAPTWTTPRGVRRTTPTARNQITPSDTFTAANVRLEKARLRRANVPTFGGSYVAYIHPDVSYDLMGQTGTNTWTDPHTYSQPDEIWQGEIGMFQGVRFIETPRAPWFGNAGSSPTTTSVYGTLFLGRQAIAKAHSIVDGNGANPHIVPGPVTDYLRRFLPLGWYHLVGYGVFRQAALRRVESASSIDDGTDSGQDNSVVYTATATNATTTLTFTATQATYLQPSPPRVPRSWWPVPVSPVRWSSCPSTTERAWSRSWPTRAVPSAPSRPAPTPSAGPRTSSTRLS